MKAGWSKIRRSYYGQAGEPTYLAIKAQAEEVGILGRNTEEPCNDDNSYLNRLVAMHRNAFGADEEVLGKAIRRLTSQSKI